MPVHPKPPQPHPQPILSPCPRTYSSSSPPACTRSTHHFSHRTPPEPERYNSTRCSRSQKLELELELRSKDFAAVAAENTGKGSHKPAEGLRSPLKPVVGPRREMPGTDQALDSVAL
ncbi:hypothetical protein GQ457_04G013060 [Hibiscus cannabinus]